jgi:hypothetical protein
MYSICGIGGTPIRVRVELFSVKRQGLGDKQPGIQPGQ